jgi:GT2 family glycosyltransferase
VVDNASTDDSVDRVRTRFPEVQVITLDRNVGFSRGNNAGLPGLTGAYVLLLNPDTEVRPGALENTLAFLDRHPEVGIAGPTLLNPDGSFQPSAGPFPSVGVEFLRQTMLWKIVPNRAQRRALRNEAWRPDQVSGAALFIRRKCLERIGPLDENLFMFYEDTDWCRRARNAGWEVAFVPGPGIVHLQGAASTGPARVRTLLASQRSAALYFRKHHGVVARAAFRGVTFLGASIRLSRAGAEWLIGWRRADRAARMRAYVRILLWSLGLDTLEVRE